MSNIPSPSFIGNSHLVALISSSPAFGDSSGGIGCLDWEAFKGRWYFSDGSELVSAFFLFNPSRYEPLLLDSGNGVVLNEELIGDLLPVIQSRRSSIVVSMLGGNEHSVFGLIENPSHYDFFLTAQDISCNVNGELRQTIPSRVLQRHMEQVSIRTITQVRLLRRLIDPAITFVHLLPPPPIGSTDQIRAQPEVFGALLDFPGIAPIGLRVKLHRIYCSVVSTALAQSGIRCLPPPPASFADDGSLREPYWLGSTHGNAAYGKLVWDQLATLR